MQLSDLASACRAIGCETEENAPMNRYTSFKIGGPADLLVTAPDAARVKNVRDICVEKGVPLWLFGNGSNLLVGDGGIRGVVLRLDVRAVQPELCGGEIYCPAGVSLKRLCVFARDNGMSGLEFAYGIPGSLGGAVYMNAGAYGGQMADVLTEADALYPDGEIRRIPLADMDLSYRHSVFMNNRSIVTAASFELRRDESAAIGERMEGFLRCRREKQPLEYPSAGSFFKRPPGHYAGALIEASGLRGRAAGGAQVSEKHAGFIINRGGATCADVRRLADEVIACVMRDHGVQLEPEVCFVGEP